jgi:NADH-quinone oxidoreductase subunit G
MAKITIDGKEIEVEDGIPLIQACEIAGIEIPRFCYHDKLRIAGNCRMCLVEVEKAPKPVASCAMPVSNGMVVHTNTPNVKKAREGVMEFLLINHPLDCPICDQGGECDLQDQAFKYGKGNNRFHENKRSVKDKHMGPLIQTHMTRCIHCTRCVRFMSDLAGVPELGATGRGEHMEITSYLEKGLTSELSGNIIDVCPVGALNSKPYAYTARSWELKHTDSIDVFDAMGSNIRIDTRGLEVMRILPRINEDINEEWISDKIRFSYDGLKLQRIDRPFVKSGAKLSPSSWDEAINAIAAKIKSSDKPKIGAIAGTMIDVESMFAMKTLLKKLGSENIDFNQFGYNFDTSSRSNYLFNTKFAGIENADLLLIIGANIRKNAPVLCARINKLSRFGSLKIARIGEEDNQTFPLEELGNDLKILDSIEKGKSEFAKKLKEAKNPVIIVGDAIYSRQDSQAILARISSICEKYNVIRDEWNGFNILHNHASVVGALDIGFYAKSESSRASNMVKSAVKGDLDILFLLGADEIEIPASHNSMIVYIGHHGDSSANIADIVLPSSAFTEKDASYINNEGTLQQAFRAVPAPSKATPEYDIVLKIAESLDLDLGFKDLGSLRKILAKELVKIESKNTISFSSKDKISDSKVEAIKFDFYLSNAISRASKTMASCSKELGSAI